VFWHLPDRDQALVSGCYDPNTATLSHVLIVERDEGQMTGLIKAPHGKWTRDKWVLRDATRLKWGKTNRQGSQQTLADERKTYSYRSDLDPDYLWLQRHSGYRNLMSSAELTELLDRPLKEPEYNEVISEKHFRLADPIINMAMLLMGLPMLVSRERRSTKTAMFLAMLGCGSCFVATFACKLLAGGVLQEPLWAAGLPVIVFLPLSIVALDGLKT